MTITSLYRRRDCVYLHAQARTRAGFWVACEPFYRIDAADQAQILEKLTYLIGLRSEATNEPISSERLQPLFELAGVSSWRQFTKATRLVLVEADNDQIRFIPQELDSKTASFTDMKSVIVTHIDESRSFIGILETVFELCRES